MHVPLYKKQIACTIKMILDLEKIIFNLNTNIMWPVSYVHITFFLDEIVYSITECNGIVF